ncbi:MAG: flagellar FlbD family protein [Clostridiales bacterium]|jgi:flagellar protein FlbD|nr:flagellar FlbD family protein [Clostridiales bacterium]
MITLTKLKKDGNDETFILNCDMIELIEEKPDTIIRLSNGKHFVVAETSDEVIAKIIEYKRKIYR